MTIVIWLILLVIVVILIIAVMSNDVKKVVEKFYDKVGAVGQPTVMRGIFANAQVSPYLTKLFNDQESVTVELVNLHSSQNMDDTKKDCFGGYMDIKAYIGLKLPNSDWGVLDNAADELLPSWDVKWSNQQKIDRMGKFFELYLGAKGRAVFHAAFPPKVKTS